MSNPLHLMRRFYSYAISALRHKNGPVKQEWSDYLQWLTYAHAGWLKPGNVHSLDYAIANLPSGAPIVEIGSFCGLSTNTITHLKEKHGVSNTLITCDRWLFEGAGKGGFIPGSQSMTHEEYRAYMKETYIRNIQVFSSNDLPFTVEMFSDEFFAAWERREAERDVLGRDVTLGGPISLCYIDGNHSYAFARRDFENADRHLENGGFILFDDSGDGSGWEVCRVVKEVIKGGRYEMVARNPNYLFRKIRPTGTTA